MFRVAVILNESELIRSGYANVVPKLRRLVHTEAYAFDSFTVTNIDHLFREGQQHLFGYDALVVTTNATSDKVVLDTLRTKASDIKSFLQRGRGLFVSSQKKLSLSDDASNPLEPTGFLPDHYDFLTLARPKKEADSGQGHIAVAPGSEGHPLLTHPHPVTAEIVTQVCQKNEFRKHFYRSHLSALSVGTYVPVLQDNSHSGAPRVLLMAGCAPQGRERVVVSTIALDWEFHQDLLTNIIKFVTEGLPRLAFLRGDLLVGDPDYDFLLASTRMSKIAHAQYSTVTDIPEHLLDVHNSFILSPAWQTDAVVQFLTSNKWLRPSGRRRYGRVYWLQRVKGSLTLSQHFSFNSVEVLLDRTAAWLRSEYKTGYWGGGFWITHDVLQMMLSNDLDCAPMISSVLSEVSKHVRDGSYDGVMGATCGLLELLVGLHLKYGNLCDAAGFPSAAVAKTAQWIHDNYALQSDGDKLTAFQTLLVAETKAGDLAQGWRMNEDTRRSIAADATQALQRSQPESDSCTEADICRWTVACLLCEPVDPSLLARLLVSLSIRQSATGMWTNPGRTAHVLTCLLQNMDRLTKVQAENPTILDCGEMVYRGLVGLRTAYNWQAASWDLDLQASSKALHALGLGNARKLLSTQDFLSALQNDDDAMQSAALISRLSARINELHRAVAEKTRTVRELDAAVRHASTSGKFLYLWGGMGLGLLVLLVAMCVFLHLEKPGTLWEMMRAAGWPSVLIGFVVVSALTWLLKRFTWNKAPGLGPSRTSGVENDL